MEAMAAPTYILPGEAPEDIVARLVAYVEQEQRQIDTHPIYGMPPNHYQVGAPENAEAPGRHRLPQFDASQPMLERVLRGLHSLDTENDPVASRRPSNMDMVNPISGVPTDWGYDGHSLVRPYVEPATTPFRAVSAPVPVIPGGFPQHRGDLYAAEETAWDIPAVPPTEQLPRRRDGSMARVEEESPAEVTDEITDPRWLRDEELDKKFARFMGAWEEADEEESRRGRHRMETRFERISKRIGLGLGVIAASSAVIYAGIELLSRK